VVRRVNAQQSSISKCPGRDDQKNHNSQRNHKQGFRAHLTGKRHHQRHKEKVPVLAGLEKEDEGKEGQPDEEAG